MIDRSPVGLNVMRHGRGRGKPHGNVVVRPKVHLQHSGIRHIGSSASQQSGAIRA